MYPFAIGGLGTTELLILLAVVILLFGASKLPELARGSGRALRIFKTETKGLLDDDDPEELAPGDRTSATEPVVETVETLEVNRPRRDATR
jgi:sec-independent protein translocase protein TatA